MFGDTSGSTGDVSIEELLCDAPESVHNSLFVELLAIELDSRLKPGGIPSAGDYVARFPGREEEVRHAFREAAGHDGANASADFGLSIGSQIGPYKLCEVIGEGGMGLVYAVEQEVPVRRIVALKIIKPGMDTKQVIARFETERQALALMEHPNITQVLDVGATKTGPRTL